MHKHVQLTFVLRFYKRMYIISSQPLSISIVVSLPDTLYTTTWSTRWPEYHSNRELTARGSGVPVAGLDDFGIITRDKRNKAGGGPDEGLRGPRVTVDRGLVNTSQHVLNRSR